MSRDNFVEYIKSLDHATLVRLIYTTKELLNYDILNVDKNSKTDFNSWFPCSDCKRIITLPDIFNVWSRLYILYYENVDFVRAVAEHNYNHVLSDELRHELSVLENRGLINLDDAEHVFKCLALVNLTFERITNGPDVLPAVQDNLKFTLNRQDLRGLFTLDFKNRYCNYNFVTLMELTDEQFDEVYELFINL